MDDADSTGTRGGVGHAAAGVAAAAGADDEDVPDMDEFPGRTAADAADDAALPAGRERGRPPHARPTRAHLVFAGCGSTCTCRGVCPYVTER